MDERDADQNAEPRNNKAKPFASIDGRLADNDTLPTGLQRFLDSRPSTPVGSAECRRRLRNQVSPAAPHLMPPAVLRASRALSPLLAILPSLTFLYGDLPVRASLRLRPVPGCCSAERSLAAALASLVTALLARSRSPQTWAAVKTTSRVEALVPASQ